MVDVWVEWMISLPIWQLYIVFFLIAYVENIFPPIPGDVLLAFGGYLCAFGELNFTALWIGSSFLSTVGFMSLHVAGKKWNDLDKKVLPWSFLAKMLNPEYENNVRRGMRKWGLGLVLLNRFLAGTRTVISLITGIAGMRSTPVLFASLGSSLLWNGLLLYAGYVVGDQWELIGGYLKSYAKWILIILALILVGRYITSLYKKSRI